MLLAGEATPIATGVPVTPVPYARFADQAGVNNDCPAGYGRVTDTADPSYAGISENMRLCVRGPRPSAGAEDTRDQVVRVGSGASAFWMDRYEATVFDRTGVRAGGYASLNNNGQWASPAQVDSLPARSVRSVVPSSGVTWFQAMSLCRASGKRLMRRDEWFAAADGLADGDVVHPTNDGNTDPRHCNTAGSRIRATGTADLCQSTWGVQDMIGNLWEWTDEWYATGGVVDPTAISSDAGTRFNGRRINPNLTSDTSGGWPSEYGGDSTSNVGSVVYRGPGTPNVVGIPAAALRGGNLNSGGLAGVFALSLDSAPTDTDSSIGFRCVIPR